MKTLAILSLLLASAVATAECVTPTIAAVTPNQSGGEMLFFMTDENCPGAQQGLDAINIEADGQALKGCRLHRNGWAIITWNDGTVKAYPMEKIGYTEKYKVYADCVWEKDRKPRPK